MESSHEQSGKRSFVDFPSLSNTFQNGVTECNSSSTIGPSDVPCENFEYRVATCCSCIICLSLPKIAIYQCQKGHLQCATCLAHNLAEARTRQQYAKCPKCNVKLTRSNATRNFVAERVASELSARCFYCNSEFCNKFLEEHEKECLQRPSKCKYSIIGCTWKGPLIQKEKHENDCTHPRYSGRDIEYSGKIQTEDAEEEQVLKPLLELLCCRHIAFLDVQIKPMRAGDKIIKLSYESSSFTYFGQEWMVRVKIITDQPDDQQENNENNQKSILYKVILKSKPNAQVGLHFFTVTGMFSKMGLLPKIEQYTFTAELLESEYYQLQLKDNVEFDRVLSNSMFNFRLLMFLEN